MKITKLIKLSKNFFWVPMSLSLLATPAFAAEFEARIGHLESAAQPRHQALLKVASVVKEKTGGAVELSFFPSSQLGNQRQMTEGTQLGVIQGTVAPAAFLGGFNKLVSVLDIPYLLPNDRKLATQLRNSEFGQSILKSFSTKGVNAIALWPNGRKNFTSNKAIDNSADFNGQRFRVMNSKILIEQFSALGASAIALPFGELYTSLQSGVVDGQENPLDTIHRMKFHEVQKYLVVSEHGAMEDIVLFNAMWWSSLPEKYRVIIQAAFVDAIPALEISKEASQSKALEMMQGSGITISTLDQKQRDELRQIMYPKAKAAYIEFAGKNGEQLLKLYEKNYQAIK